VVLGNDALEGEVAEERSNVGQTPHDGGGFLGLRDQDRFGVIRGSPFCPR
jgi:hypothetical protein